MAFKRSPLLCKSQKVRGGVFWIYRSQFGIRSDLHGCRFSLENICLRIAPIFSLRLCRSLGKRNCIAWIFWQAKAWLPSRTLRFLAFPIFGKLPNSANAPYHRSHPSCRMGNTLGGKPFIYWSLWDRLSDLSFMAVFHLINSARHLQLISLLGKVSCSLSWGRNTSY